jgi:hypothetical protein
MMAKPPPFIWCNSGLYYDYKKDWSEGSWTTYDDDGVKYIRVDAKDELEKALRKLKETDDEDS